MSTVRANSYYDASGGSNAVLYGVASPPNSMGFRNRLINPGMVIDQRNNGASVTSGFPVDRWSIGASQASKFTAQRNAGGVTPPVGFTNYLGMTSSSAYSVTSTDYFFVSQTLEGFNAADFAWGGASAVSVTLSFRVYSSLTGTFGGSIKNAAGNRSYPFSYTISSANTWTTISVTIPGDTSGTWPTDNSAWGYVIFCLGSGSTRLGTANTWAGANYDAPTGATSVVATNGATFYITGVQLEAGTNASAFERRDYGRELAMCQRYFQSYVFATGGVLPGTGVWRSSTRLDANAVLPVVMRATPTIGTTNVGNIQVYDGGSSRAATAIADNGSTAAIVGLNISVASGGTEGRGGYLQATGATAGYTLSIEL